MRTVRWLSPWARAAMAEAEDGSEPVDSRLEWIERWIELKLAVKPAVFKKMMGASDPPCQSCTS